MINSRTALVGAVGGAHIAFALCDIDELSIEHFALLSSADFSSPMEALARYLTSLPEVPDKAALTVAGTVNGDVADMPGFGWHFSARDVGAVCRVQDVVLLPELHALTLAAPQLAAADLVPVVVPPSPTKGPVLAILSGTDFGAALRADERDHVRIHIGHAELMTLPRGEGTAGEMLTLAGLARHYSDRAAGGQSPSMPKATGPEVLRLGMQGENASASALLDEVTSHLAEMAVELALAYGATGGVYLAGHLAAGLLPARAETFRAAWNRRAAAAPVLSACRVTLVKTSADAALRGAALALAARPMR